jgi:hypothetical protein
MIKKCIKCKIEKPFLNFSKNKRQKDGLQKYCKYCHKIYIRQYQRDNKERVLTRIYKWVKNNQEKRKNTNKKYYKNNKKKINKKNVKYAKKRYKTDIGFKIRINLSNRLRLALNRENVTKIYKTLDYLGISIPEFKKHLEKQFYANFKTGEIMSWENKHKWHLDHIIPCSSYDLKQIEAQRKCFHYTNLRPLWAEDNLKKGNKLNYEME